MQLTNRWYLRLCLSVFAAAFFTTSAVAYTTVIANRSNSTIYVADSLWQPFCHYQGPDWICEQPYGWSGASWYALSPGQSHTGVGEGRSCFAVLQNGVDYIPQAQARGVVFADQISNMWVFPTQTEYRLNHVGGNLFHIAYVKRENSWIRPTPQGNLTLAQIGSYFASIGMQNFRCFYIRDSYTIDIY